MNEPIGNEEIEKKLNSANHDQNCLKIQKLMIL